MPVKVKLCGLKDKATILAAAKADFIGFVFYQKSSRFINAFDAKKLIQYISAEQKVVGLFVNSDINTLYHINDFLNLDLIQLHGNEDLNYIEKVKNLVNQSLRQYQLRTLMISRTPEIMKKFVI